MLLMILHYLALEYHVLGDDYRCTGRFVDLEYIALLSYPILPINLNLLSLESSTYSRVYHHQSSRIAW
jgi:hypothetical protein